MVKSEFKITSWDEKPYFEGENNVKLTRAVITKSYAGDISGTGALDYLMAYNPDGSAWFVGIERIEGKIGTKTGSFILSHEGTFQKGVASSSFKVIEGSATAELRGLSGTGGFSTGHSRSVPIDFKYVIEHE